MDAAPAEHLPRSRGLFSTAARWITWILLILVPLAILPNVPSTINTHVLVKWVLLGLCGAVILLLGGLALLVERESVARARGWFVTPSSWGFLAFAGVAVAATLASEAPAYCWRNVWLILTPLGMAVVCGWAFKTPAQARSAGRLMIAGGILVALIGFLDAIGILPMFRWTYGASMEDMVDMFGPDYFLRVQGGMTRGRLLSTLGNPAYVGGFLVVPAVLLASWLLGGWEGERPPRKRALMGWAGLLVIGVTLVATSTREAWVGVFVGLAARVALAEQPEATGRRTLRFFRALPARAWLALAGMILGLMALLVVFSTPNPVNVRGWNAARRFAELADLRSESMQGRITFYTLAGRMFAERPWLGWGPGMYGVRFYPTIEEFLDEGPYGPWARIVDTLQGRVADKPHNDVLQLTVEFGVLGVAAFFWIVASVLVAVVTGSRHPAQFPAPPSAGTLRVLGSAWIASLATLLTSFPLHTPERALYFWTLTGLLASLVAMARTSSPPVASSARH